LLRRLSATLLILCQRETLFLYFSVFQCLQWQIKSCAAAFFLLYYPTEILPFFALYAAAAKFLIYYAINKPFSKYEAGNYDTVAAAFTG
jgi:uncharacterized membrane protein